MGKKIVLLVGHFKKILLGFIEIEASSPTAIVFEEAPSVNPLSKGKNLVVKEIRSGNPTEADAVLYTNKEGVSVEDARKKAKGEA